jgi:hypothetical protein
VNAHLNFLETGEKMFVIVDDKKLDHIEYQSNGDWVFIPAPVDAKYKDICNMIDNLPKPNRLKNPFKNASFVVRSLEYFNYEKDSTADILVELLVVPTELTYLFDTNPNVSIWELSKIQRAWRYYQKRDYDKNSVVYAKSRLNGIFAKTIESFDTSTMTTEQLKEQLNLLTNVQNTKKVESAIKFGWMIGCWDSNGNFILPVDELKFNCRLDVMYELCRTALRILTQQRKRLEENATSIVLLTVLVARIKRELR